MQTATQQQQGTHLNVQGQAHIVTTMPVAIWRCNPQAALCAQNLCSHVALTSLNEAISSQAGQA
jgi:hypothetical protein